MLFCVLQLIENVKLYLWCFDLNVRYLAFVSIQTQRNVWSENLPWTCDAWIESTTLFTHSLRRCNDNVTMKRANSTFFNEEGKSVVIERCTFDADADAVNIFQLSHLFWIHISFLLFFFFSSALSRTSENNFIIICRWNESYWLFLSHAFVHSLLLYIFVFYLEHLDFRFLLLFHGNECNVNGAFLRITLLQVHWIFIESWCLPFCKCLQKLCHRRKINGIETEHRRGAAVEQKDKKILGLSLRGCVPNFFIWLRKTWRKDSVAGKLPDALQMNESESFFFLLVLIIDLHRKSNKISLKSKVHTFIQYLFAIFAHGGNAQNIAVYAKWNKSSDESQAKQ